MQETAMTIHYAQSRYYSKVSVTHQVRNDAGRCVFIIVSRRNGRAWDAHITDLRAYVRGMGPAVHSKVCAHSRTIVEAMAWGQAQADAFVAQNV